MICRCQKLTALQSRFLASFIALIFLGVVYWSLANPQFAYASELNVDGAGRPRSNEDVEWSDTEEKRWIEDGVDVSMGDEENSRRIRAAPTEFGGNDVPAEMTIQPGKTNVFMYSNKLRTETPNHAGKGLPFDEAIDGRDVAARNDLKRREEMVERQSGVTIWVSINTCRQPLWNGTATQTTAPPQLTLYVSTDASNKDPGPGRGNSSQIMQPLVEGFANISVTATDSWYMAVGAPELPNDFNGEWNYELAVSLTAYYHAAETDPSKQMLLLIDTDDNSALLVTDNLTQSDANSPNFQRWMDLSTPFGMFGANDDHTSVLGVQSSYCGWVNAQQIASDAASPDGQVQMGMITRGLGNKPKEQFYITSLNSSSVYNGVLAMHGNSTAAGSGVVGGGGKVWPLVQWTTKADGNCALLFNLSFCSEVAYAVPSNPSKLNLTGMRELFDNYTSVNYEQFDFSLQQIACNISSDAQYTLARNCDDCAAAYKEWLCAVSIPRCEDFTNPAPFLQPRNVGQSYENGSMLPMDYLNQQYIPMSKAPTLEGSPRDKVTYLSSIASNSSRNPIIDEQIQPGPYKEVLPCEDLCYGLMQSCPASLGFNCPRPGRGLEVNYGKRSNGGEVTCSYLGAVYSISAATHESVPRILALAMAGLLGFLIA